MCLILVGLGQHPAYPLIIAANRDEWHERPAQVAEFWPDRLDILAGRDLRAGGTWLGINRSGACAMVTNYQEAENRDAPGSRGELVRQYLEGAAPANYGDLVLRAGARYRGFNLLFGNRHSIYYVSNRGPGVQKLAYGLHGLTNGALRSGCPRARHGENLLAAAIANGPTRQGLFALLADGRSPVGSARRRHCSFMVGEHYGTRASTIVLMRADGRIEFAERTFLRGGIEKDERCFILDRETPAPGSAPTGGIKSQ